MRNDQLPGKIKVKWPAMETRVFNGVFDILNKTGRAEK
jgi:hypothetical protein